MFPKKIKKYVSSKLVIIQIYSLRAAAKEQGLSVLAARLERIVPDISAQYSRFKLSDEYLTTKVRMLHAFQMSLVEKVLTEFEKAVIVDIGDSAGTHLQYIKGLCAKNQQIRCLSVNLDLEAVKRIQAKGLEALHTRVEELRKHRIDADIFLCFQTLEHLVDPCRFLFQLSAGSNATYLIATVPYLKKSRVGLHHIRQQRKEDVYAENTHIFELCPDDWKLLVQHCGWNVLTEEVYLQYPRKNVLRLTRSLWRKHDFEGFYGMILRRDHAWSTRYKDWQEEAVS